VLSLTCALVATAVVGLAFATTRKIGLLCLAGLVLLHPIVLPGLVAVGGGVAYLSWRARVRRGGLAHKAQARRIER
jgi:hypothetical protein